MVFGTATIGMPISQSRCAIFSVPSPPIATMPSRPRARMLSMTSERAVDAADPAVVDDRVLERIAAVGGAEQRAAFREDAADRLVVQRDDVIGQQPLEAELDADHFRIVALQSPDRGPDHCVEARAIAAAGEDSDLFDSWLCLQIVLIGDPSSVTVMSSEP